MTKTRCNFHIYNIIYIILVGSAIKKVMSARANSKKPALDDWIEDGIVQTVGTGESQAGNTGVLNQDHFVQLEFQYFLADSLSFPVFNSGLRRIKCSHKFHCSSLSEQSVGILGLRDFFYSL